MTARPEQLNWSVARVPLLLIFLTMMSAPLRAACNSDEVLLRGDWGQARFGVEVADDAIERQQGLMHRQELPRTSGMLFVYHTTRVVSFWMKNTLIPLDIIFLDETGTIVHIHENAVPLDLTSISSQRPTRYVLEINAGMSRLLGLTIGSELRHPAVLQHKAAWPCHGEYN